MDHTGYTEAWAIALYERDGGSLKGHATVREYIVAEVGFMRPTSDEIDFMVGAYEQAKRDNAAPSDDAYNKALDEMGPVGLPFPDCAELPY